MLTILKMALCIWALSKGRACLDVFFYILMGIFFIFGITPLAMRVWGTFLSDPYRGSDLETAFWILVLVLLFLFHLGLSSWVSCNTAIWPQGPLNPRDQRDSRFSRILENFFSFSLLVLDLESFQFHCHFSKKSEGILFFTFYFSKK